MSMALTTFPATQMFGVFRKFLPTAGGKWKDCQKLPFVVVYTSARGRDASLRDHSAEFQDFKSSPPVPFPSPGDLAAEIPFQFWYSFADLPVGTPKRRPKNNRKDLDRPVIWRRLAHESKRKLSTNSKRAIRTELEPSKVSKSGDRAIDGPLFAHPEHGASRTEAMLSTCSKRMATEVNENDAYVVNHSGDLDNLVFQKRVSPEIKRGQSTDSELELSTNSENEDDDSELESSTDSDYEDHEIDGHLCTDSGNGAGQTEGSVLAAVAVDKNAPLSKEEKKRLIERCCRGNRLINIGWRMWEVNYVPLVHNYWKKNPVCKIRCKGAITLDMDLVCKTLEQNTGGTVLARPGGTIYLFRGRNYDYSRDAPQKQVRKTKRRQMQPLPKRLPIPCNLTKEDIVALRTRARELPALCKPARNGVYLTLLKDVRKAFKTQDLVRVNCQGFESRYMKTLGAELKARVPCELISFEFEHILMWRNKGNEPVSPLHNSNEPVSPKMESD